MPPTRERRWWTSPEDDILRNGVQIQCNESGSVHNWNDIAVFLPGRTNKDCRKRWSKVQLDIRKGAWTRDEDKRLRQAVQQLGFKWSQVATLVQSRNADQCAKRWQHVSGPDFKRSPWTPEEDRKLLEAMLRHGNNWKHIGLTDLPDRSTHDIRNRSLLLGRRSRNMLARRSVSAQQPSLSSIDDDVVGDGSDRDDDDDDDDDTCERSSECEYTGSVGLHHPQEPSGTAVTQQETTVAPEPGIDSSSIMHFQQPHAPLETPQGTGSFFDPSWTGATGQVQTYPELPTPGSDCLSWLSPFEVSTSTVTGSQPSWWTKSPMDEHSFHNSEPFDIGFLDMPRSSDGSRGKGQIESNGENTTWENEKKGSVTLTLSQVDPDVAQEIMGSLLKHSAGLKIRCIVNDD
ncbi:hypothetical protein MMC22_009386 [Lobaria immixta]|nr:hypothetical protein [Lobaria immixta]